MQKPTRTYPCPDCGEPMVLAVGESRPLENRYGRTREALYGCPVVLAARKTRKTALVLAGTGHVPYARWWPEWMAQAFADHATCPVWDANSSDDSSPF